MLIADSQPKTFVQLEPRTLVVIGITLLPWLAVMLLGTGIRGTSYFVAYAAMTLLIGYSILRVALPAPVRIQSIFLAPALGILIVSALSALCLRVRFPLAWIPALWLGLALVGAAAFWIDRRSWMKATVAYGRSLAVLSTLVCLVYFLPSARKDAVFLQDGSFHWIYVDTQQFYAIAASIKNGESPPVEPGTATEQLRYHFGPYASAAVVSRATGLDLGDALARITRGVSIWGLALSCFGLGTQLSVRATGEKFGGIMSVAGLFFYGSLLSLFSNEWNSASHVTGAILLTIPGVEVLANGGPFSHIILGSSVLHGIVAITTVLGLCLIQRTGDMTRTWGALMLLVLPALVVPNNSVAALYCLGAAVILLFWGRLGDARSWLSIVGMFCLFFVVWRIMGYSHATDTARAMINRHPDGMWWPLAVTFLVGLGVRLLAFRWISQSWTDPLAALVLASVLGLLAFNFLIFEDGQQRYGLYFLQCLFSIFAFSRMAHGFWRRAERSQWVAEWLRLARRGAIVFAGCGVLIAAAMYVTHRHPAPYFRLKVFVVILVVALLFAVSALMKRTHSFSTICSAILASVLLFGFSAWITPWLNFGIGRMKMGITIPAGTVRGLHRLHTLAAPGELFATNTHTLSGLVSRRERSYVYSALSERAVLLEGYQDRGLEHIPRFANMLHDNELMFTTIDPDTLHDLAESYHVHWLVARPGTDISLAKPLPPWLIPEKDCGSLKIYQIK